MAPRTPNGLGRAGKALWRSIAGGEYDLRPDELRILEDACRLADIVTKLEAELASQTLTVAGSMGQPVPNGHLPEIRQYRGTIARNLSLLKLPDANQGEKMSPSETARAAAQARWSKKASGA